MRLLVTRPFEQAARTAEKLLALGCEPILAPVLVLRPTGAQIPSGPFDLVLATSAQAFFGSPSALAPLACVGERTAAAGRAVGFQIRLIASDSEALAENLLRQASPGRALYLAGETRKPELERRLRAAGWEIEPVETYAAVPVEAWPKRIDAALAAGEIDGVLHYSPRSAALGLERLGSAALGLAHFCLSPAIAEMVARKVSPQLIFVASRAEEDALMTLVQSRTGALGR